MNSRLFTILSFALAALAGPMERARAQATIEYAGATANGAKNAQELKRAMYRSYQSEVNFAGPSEAQEPRAERAPDSQAPSPREYAHPDPVGDIEGAEFLPPEQVYTPE